jgi:uncharacterized protein YcfJ
MSKCSVVLVALVLSVSFGCATYRPIVDTKGVDMAAYETDMHECQAYAEGQDPAAKAAAGAVAGAALGAVIAAMFGGNRGSRNRSAAVGGLSGAGAGASSAMQAQTAITRNCMAGRGYKVLY